MYRNSHVIAIVPARGGSKGVPRKNIHPLCGKPLLAYTADIIREVGIFDRAIVSTDDSEIAAVAMQYGLEAPFMRPQDLSGDLISDYAVLRHALGEVERFDKRTYDIIVLLQPTSPLRRARHIESVVEKLMAESYDSVWTVSETDLKYHPLKQLLVDSHGSLEYYDQRAADIIARQQLSAVYHRNGAAYALTRACLLEQKTIKGRKTGAVIIREPLISIDTLEDFARVETEMHSSHG